MRWAASLLFEQMRGFPAFSEQVDGLLVEADERLPAQVSATMGYDGVSEIATRFELCQTSSHSARLNDDVVAVDKFPNHLGHIRCRKSIDAAQHPAAFNERRDRDRHQIGFGEELLRLRALNRIVFGHSSYENVGIGRDPQRIPAHPSAIASFISSIEIGRWPSRFSIPKTSEILPAGRAASTSIRPFGSLWTTTFAPVWMPRCWSRSFRRVICPFPVTVRIVSFFAGVSAFTGSLLRSPTNVMSNAITCKVVLCLLSMTAPVAARAQQISRDAAARAAIHPVASAADLTAWLSRVPRTRAFPPDFAETLRGQSSLYIIEMTTAPDRLPCADLWTKLGSLRARYGWQVRTELVQELAEDKLNAIADEYRAIGWHEVGATLDRPYDLYMKGSMYPATREPTEAEAERLAEIELEIETIAEKEGEDSDRIEPLCDERDAITEGLRAFNAQQVAVGGVALWVSHDGSLGKSFYRAKAEPKPKAGSGDPQPLYSNSLFADLTRIKTQIVQEAVAADPALALDVLLDSLAGQLLHGAHSYQIAIEVQAKTVATDVPDELMVTSDVRPVEEVMATRFASIPAEGRFEAIRAMTSDDKMALLAGLVAMTVDGTVFAGGSTGRRHHHFEQVARASGVDIAARWSAPIALFDKMRRAAMIDLLREECGALSAENCATIKKKGDLAVNVSERLPATWLPAPMKIGAFDQPEADPEDFDSEIDGDVIEDMADDAMADDEMA